MDKKNNNKENLSKENNNLQHENNNQEEYINNKKLDINEDLKKNNNKEKDNLENKNITISHDPKFLVLSTIITYNFIIALSIILFKINKNYFIGIIELKYQILLGIIFAIIFIALFVISKHFFEVVKRAEQDLRNIFGNLKLYHILIISIFSGIGEEILFRGGLQPHLGIILTSIIFGLLHPPLTPNLKFYPFAAFITSIGLGWLFIYTQSLIAPITAHFFINFLNLYRLSLKKE